MRRKNRIAATICFTIVLLGLVALCESLKADVWTEYINKSKAYRVKWYRVYRDTTGGLEPFPDEIVYELHAYGGVNWIQFFTDTLYTIDQPGDTVFHCLRAIDTMGNVGPMSDTVRVIAILPPGVPMEYTPADLAGLLLYGETQLREPFILKAHLGRDPAGFRLTLNMPEVRKVRIGIDLYLQYVGEGGGLKMYLNESPTGYLFEYSKEIDVTFQAGVSTINVQAENCAAFLLGMRLNWIATGAYWGAPIFIIEQD